MNERPLLTTIPLWDRFEARIIELTEHALHLMRRSPSLPEEEVDLNRKLRVCIHDALWELRGSDTGLDAAPFIEACNQPDPDDATRAVREDKRPDLQWELKDSQAVSSKEYIRFYAIECKRLGYPPSPSWILNQQYVVNGIRRFIKAEYGYGTPRSNPSAAMIGYVQNMDLEKIQQEINDFAKTHSIPDLQLSAEGWRQKNISKLSHKLDRPEIHPSPLTLNHIWIDIRDIPISVIKKKRVKKSRKVTIARRVS